MSEALIFWAVLVVSAAPFAYGCICLVAVVLDLPKWRQKAREKRINAYRRRKPVQIVGVPDLESLKKLNTLLDEFISWANSYLSFPFDEFFPRQLTQSDDGPDPAPYEMILQNMAISHGRDMRSIYGTLGSLCSLPCKEPMIVFSAPAPPITMPDLPDLPAVPSPRIKVAFCSDGSNVDWRVAANKKNYQPEFGRVKELEGQANRLCEEYSQKKKAAVKAADLMDKQTRWMREIYEDYMTHSPYGIEKHFNLALRTLPLPLPVNFPWNVIYSPSDRILQVNQRVPALADIVLKRLDSKRMPSKKDTDYFLRRIIPAISLHIAQHIASNDLLGDVDNIAVNCWCRYYEKTSGRLKNAFLSSLNVEKTQILEVHINKADALEAFRALRGAFVFSVEEVSPIEPQIRLDKKDDRFVEGKEVLEGLAQGQNLATMDWQEFEHLIRELLSKEFAKKSGAEVKITRASRDRGVDAVIFDPDPLHGGKYVVQAKRYNTVVDVSAVRDLYGTVHNEGADRGILVTTSRYGRDAYDFASNKPLTLIDGQNLLSFLAKHGYRFKIELL